MSSPLFGGWFAGVATATLALTGTVRWGNDHRCLARANTVWLADVIVRVENCPALLDRVSVQAAHPRNQSLLFDQARRAATLPVRLPVR